MSIQNGSTSDIKKQQNHVNPHTNIVTIERNINQVTSTRPNNSENILPTYKVGNHPE